MTKQEQEDARQEVMHLAEDNAPCMCGHAHKHHFEVVFGRGDRACIKCKCQDFRYRIQPT